MHPSAEPNPPDSGRRFAQTRWSLVACVQDGAPGSARQALIELCLRYWFPVYAYVRGCGHSEAVAQDISRGFFEHLVQNEARALDGSAGGRFRDFLLDALHRYLGSDWRQARDVAPVPEFEPVARGEWLEARYRAEPDPSLPPERGFQRSYALQVLAAALSRLREEAGRAGREAMFEAMEPYLSREPLPGEFDALARASGLRPLAVVVALKRLRQRFRELADAELEQTVSSADDLRAEREALARALELR